jgi:hypothetical protein
VIAILCGAMLLGMLAMLGMALDLAQLYNRKAELQMMADAAALAAARELNGTESGVSNAVAAAAATAGKFTYRYTLAPVIWSGAALRFAATPATSDEGWADASAAQAAPARMMYARVDTQQLNAAHGLVEGVFRQLGSAGHTAARAVAGRATTPVTPLAICAQAPAPAAARVNVGSNSNFNELVEFGFRRGVSYDLMHLNPGGVAPEHFLIDPLAAPGMPGIAAEFATAVVAPFVCTGQLAMPSVMGGTLTVQRGFPLDALYPHLNARFDDYSGGVCLPETAPPDSNIKPYPYTASWQTPAPAAQTAASWISDGSRLWTRADPLPGDASNTAPQYGPLWSGARAVPYAAYTAQPVEPVGGYSVFATSAWSSLYTPNPPAAAGYPTNKTNATPYSQTSGATYFQAPAPEHQPGVANRRMLNVALLACPVAAGTISHATVLGVGRFFMTVPATATSLSAEFAGTLPAASSSGMVELLR